jgi:hypothetical protein
MQKKRYILDGKHTINSKRLSTVTSLKGKTELSIQLALRYLRIPTGRLRLLPNFLIIGAQKSGTTTLYKYLNKHPNVHRSWFKEVHFFDRYYKKGVNWYKSHFPLKIYKNMIVKFSAKAFITGEASPDYLFYSHVPKKVYSIIPKVKLIVLLRNPIDRAFSHYNHEFLRQREYLTFDKAIRLEKKRIKLEKAKVLENNTNYSFIYDHFTYCTRGIYANQLYNWKRIFPTKQIFIINSEKFFKKPQKIYSKILEFLCLPEHKLIYQKKFNVGKYKSKLDKKLREELIEFYKPHNQRLFNMIGERYDWDQ